MGTTLTGTTPQDTYDSLIKVTDNGPLSGSLKVLTDGLGNNSTLSLSTAAASIAGTLAVSGNATFDTNVLVVDATNNRVGVGIASPTTLLDIQAAGSAVGSIRLTSAVNTNGAAYFVENAGGGSYFGRNSSTGGAFTGAAYSTVLYGGGAYPLSLYTNDAERMRITSDGNVGIGTTAPTTKLTVSGVIRLFDGSLTGGGGVELSSEAGFGFAAQAGKYKFQNANNNATYVTLDSDGLKFNGDTAAANALDDYEEGTWTMGIAFGGLSVGVTTSSNTGTYTKIGRQVTVNGYLVLTSKGSSTGDATITGLPFTIGNSNSNYVVANLRMNAVSFANQFQAFGVVNATTIYLGEITEAGSASPLVDSNLANNSDIMLSFTYFV